MPDRSLTTPKILPCSGSHAGRRESLDPVVPKLSDVRKTRLTLAHINSLRMMNDVRKFEEEHRMDDIHRQYGAKSAG